MKIITTARHCELAAEDREFVQHRLERLLRYFREPRDLIEAHVVVGVEKYRHSAEITREGATDHDFDPIWTYLNFLPNLTPWLPVFLVGGP